MGRVVPDEPQSAAGAGRGPAERSAGTVRPASAEANGGDAADDDAARAWPTETDEAAYRAEAAAGEEIPAAGTARPLPGSAAADETAGELPALDQLVQRIPAGVREALDELFRARFTRVVRIRAK